MPSIMEKKTSGLTTALARGGVKSIKPKKVWEGPMDPGLLGGITQSMLQKFLVCRDRFRLRHIEGLDAVDSFSHRLEYGNMWHVCEEYHHKGQDWLKPLQEYCKKLKDRYRTQHGEIDHWYEVCKRQFPAYLKYWSTVKPVGKRQSVIQEQVFHVPYTLPWSGRVVYLRGKWDGAHILSGCKSPKPGLWLDENKTKGDIDEQQLQRNLTFDLQTMFYLVAFRIALDDFGINGSDGFSGLPDCDFSKPLCGVRYNVIRRPLSGGKGSIKQLGPSKKNPRGESLTQYYDRLRDEYLLAEPKHFFMRWTVEVSPREIDVFRKTCLDPVLEQLCDWYCCVSPDKWQPSPYFYKYQNFRFPYGVYSALTEGKPTGLDEYLMTGSMTGLRRGVPLFEELQ